MAHLTRDKNEVNARIVYWGISGAGVSTNLRVIHEKLRSDLRGELQRVPTALDPTTHYEMLPIELGQVNGLRTRLQVVGLPGSIENAPTRKQLLDHVDGVVFIIDSQPDRLEENIASLAELRESLAAYGRSLEELPMVVEYNKRDLSDPYTIEELHRRLAIPGAAVFEANAPQGTGVLQTLTTISKQVIRVLRESDFEPPPAPPIEAPELEPEQHQAPVETAPPSVEPEPPIAEPEPPIAEPEPPIAEPEPPSHDPQPSAADLMEEAILAEGEALDAEGDDVAYAAEQALDTPLDRPWEAVSEEMKQLDGARIGADFELVSVGTATKDGTRAVRIPLVLGNPEGETVTLALTVQLDPLLDTTDD